MLCQIQQTGDYWGSRCGTARAWPPDEHTLDGAVVRAALLHLVVRLEGAGGLVAVAQPTAEP